MGTAPTTTTIPVPWVEERPDHYCKDHRPKYGYLGDWGDLVTDQISCQKQCELDNECIGISYCHSVRYKQTFKSWCFICTSDKNIVPFRYQFGFHRKPVPSQ